MSTPVAPKPLELRAVQALERIADALEIFSTGICAAYLDPSAPSQQEGALTQKMRSYLEQVKGSKR